VIPYGVIIFAELVDSAEASVDVELVDSWEASLEDVSLEAPLDDDSPSTESSK